MKEALAIKYRPKEFQDVVEQDSIKTILRQQLDSNSTKNAYLFVGGAGTGKTTTARIFADEINKHEGHPIELDAASNSGVEDVRNIIQQAKTKSLDSEYKVFIIDECHSLSNTAWQAFLKLIEEPPAKSVFIFCTTNPEKIPKTILSRVQRYTFKRISQHGIVDRLQYILDDEHLASYHIDAIEYLAKLADGGMRDAITLMDKCLSYSEELTVENIVKALGIANYDTMINLTDTILDGDISGMVQHIEEVHASGVELKQFIKDYTDFILDVNKYMIFGNFDFIKIPSTHENKDWLDAVADSTVDDAIPNLLSTLISLNSAIKYDSSPKYLIEAYLLGGLDG